MLYTSINNAKIKDLKKLQNKKYRDLERKFLIETKHLILEAYQSGLLDEVLLKEGSELDIDVYKNYASANVLKYLSNMPSPSEVIGVCHKKENTISGNKILMLDNIQDPGNIGTIIRSSVAFNIDTIILGPGCADVYSDKVIRSSQGMLFKINIVKADLKETIKKLKENDFKIFGTNVTNGTDVKNISKPLKYAVVMGNEAAGVSEEILKECSEYIYIPMNKQCESLNVGVAASIILYEFR